MDDISTIQLSNGVEIDILIKNGKIGYTFEYNKQNYGTAIRPKSRKVKDIVDACLLLLINAEQTYKELTKDKKCWDAFTKKGKTESGEDVSFI